MVSIAVPETDKSLYPRICTPPLSIVVPLAVPLPSDLYPTIWSPPRLIVVPLVGPAVRHWDRHPDKFLDIAEERNLLAIA